MEKMMRKLGPPLELTPENERDIERVLRDMIERDESVAARFERIMCTAVVMRSNTFNVWQSIETAPKNEWILATEETGTRIDQVRWVQVANGEGYNWVTLDSAWQPNDALKYWMPLPEPPK
jgi:hypothetical protein